MSDTHIEMIAPSVFASTESGTVYQFESKNHSRSKPDVQRVGAKEVIKWGGDNMLPYVNRTILAENDIKQNLIETDVNIAAGQYLYLYSRKVENGKEIITPVEDAELTDWLEEFRVHEQFTETIQDIKEMGNSWMEFVLNRARTKVVSMNSLDAVDCRLSKNATGSTRRDSEKLLLADWKYGKLLEDEIQQVDLLDIRNPKLGEQVKCALHVKKITSGMPYYQLVEWFGTKDWTEIANIIPKFHKQGLKNGYMLRYHVKIPMSYVEKQNKSPQEVKKDIITELDKVLSGAENAHKTFNSFINDKIGLQGTAASEFKIEKIETDLKDESYLKLHENASMVHARGHNLDPALAGFETQGRMSSGSEIKNKLNFHIAYKTPRIRRIAMAPFLLAKNFNFPDKKDIHIGIGDMDFTTLDENPSGAQQIITPN